MTNHTELIEALRGLGLRNGYADDEILRDISSGEWEEAFARDFPRLIVAAWRHLSHNQRLLFYLRWRLADKGDCSRLADLLQQETDNKNFSLKAGSSAKVKRELNWVNYAVKDGERRLFELLLSSEEMAKALKKATTITNCDNEAPLHKALVAYLNEQPQGFGYRAPWERRRLNDAPDLKKAILAAYCKGRQRPPIVERLPVWKRFGDELAEFISPAHRVGPIERRNPS